MRVEDDHVRSRLGPLVGRRRQDVLAVHDAAAYVTKYVRGGPSLADRNHLDDRPSAVGDDELLTGLLHLPEILQHVPLQHVLGDRGHDRIMVRVTTPVKIPFYRSTAWPSASSVAIRSASANVGWAWIV